MKKRTKQLSFTIETVRRLSSEDLAQARGGVVASAHPKTCVCDSVFECAVGKEP